MFFSPSNSGNKQTSEGLIALRPNLLITSKDR